MVAGSDFLYFRGYSKQRGRGFGALAQTIGRTAIPFLRSYVVPAAKRFGADLLGIAAPKTGNVLTEKKKIKSVTADVEKKTLRKQLGGGKIKKSRIIQIIRPKTSRRRRTRKDFFSKPK